MAEETLIWTVLGFVAGGLTSLATLPQILNVIKTKKVDEISLTMLSMFLVGGILWFFYGLAIKSWPVIIVNVVFTIGNITLISLKLRYQKGEELTTPLPIALKE
ncbi:MAG: hypothetical protein EPN86_00360 [Nanoarchaeota archaeon]|nr:MAG: hypothetical protein EPN86_00360 [Nanoarchaeota archaeon]